jgi:SAM-dependent methyltransferase
VLDATGVTTGTTVLDLGCGSGLFARAAADRGARVTGIDLDPPTVARAAAEVPEGSFAVGDVHHPPPGPFDVVAAVQLLMHVVDPAAVLAAAGRSGAACPGRCGGRFVRPTTSHPPRGVGSSPTPGRPRSPRR